MGKLELGRIGVFCALAFGFSWTIFWLLINTGNFTPGVTMVLGLAMAMWGPGLANLLTRFVTKEGFSELGLGKIAWRQSGIAIVVTPILIGLGTLVYFLCFPSQFDASSPLLASRAAQGAVSVHQLLMVQIILALVVSPLVNVPACLGEELGWRGYLQTKLLPLGERRALIITGLVWGFWHAPIIAAGYNYGLNYPAAPWLGILMMMLVTSLLSLYFGWLRLRGDSLWPAVFAHGSVNGMSAIGTLFLADTSQAKGLLGPAPVGLIGAVGFALFAVYILPRLSSSWSDALPSTDGES